MGGASTGSNTNLKLGYRSSTVIIQAHYDNDMNFTTTSYASPTPAMHTFWFSKTSGKKYWLKGGNTADQSSSGQVTALISYAGAKIGGGSPNFYNGDIAEIIIFARDLKDEERQAIESYLSKKYNIAITG